jgi:hypothetical protein
MEGVSGEGVRRRRREYSEETEETSVEDLTATELVRARERALEVSETEEQASVSARELVEQVVKELREEEETEGEISHKLEDALEDLEKMEKSSESTEEKLRKALEEIDEQERKEVIDEPSEVQDETKESRFGEISTKEEYDKAVENHSEMKLRKSYEKDESEASEYFEKLDNGEDVEKPSIVEEVESRELRRVYESVHDGPPEVYIDSMKDVDDLLEKYPEEHEREGFDEKYRRSEVYFEVKDKHSIPREELAEIHNVSRQFVGFCGNGLEPTQIRRLRDFEEERIVREWAQSNPEIDTEAHHKTRAGENYKSIEELETHKTVYQIDSQIVRETVAQLKEFKDLSSESIISTVERLHQSASPEHCAISYANLKPELDRGNIRQLERVLHEHRDEIEKSLSERFELENVRPRVAIVNDRLYTWIPKSRPGELVEAYEKQFYYFRDSGEIVHIVEDLRNQLGIEDSLHKSLTHVNKVIRQMTAGDEGEHARALAISGKSTRLEGKTVRFYLDATGRRLSNLEGRVTKVTGINGQAGIENPRFPEGKELEVLKARLASIIASDCHLRESGRISYDEAHLERIDRVQEILNNFGDFKLEAKFRSGSYEVHIQNQIGLIMIHEGMTPGNKTIQNPGLPEGHLDWSEEARCAYLEELIPEDGSFSTKRGFSWFRNHALYDRDAIREHGFTSQITTREIELVKAKGNPSEGLIDQYELSFGALERLQQSENQNHSQAAKNLVQTISNSPNSLIEDERRLAENLGIKITLSPTSVKYFPKSDRVSIKYTACTTSKSDAIRWGEICPPNDDRKRNKVESWLREIVEDWLDKKEWVD